MERGKMCVTGKRLALPYLPPAAAATGSQMQRARAAVSKRSLYQRHTGSPHQIQTQQEDTPGLHYLFKTPISMQRSSEIICNFVGASEIPRKCIKCVFLVLQPGCSLSPCHTSTHSLHRWKEFLSLMIVNTHTHTCSMHLSACWSGSGQDATFHLARQK